MLLSLNKAYNINYTLCFIYNIMHMGQFLESNFFTQK